jgi:hypothetical protein
VKTGISSKRNTIEHWGEHRHQSYYKPNRKLRGTQASVVCSPRFSIGFVLRLMPVFTSVFYWVCNKTDACVHLAFLLGLHYDWCLCSPQFSIGFVLRLMPVFPSVFCWVCNTTDACVHLSVLLCLFYDWCLFSPQFSIGFVIRLMPVFTSVFYCVSFTTDACFHLSFLLGLYYVCYLCSVIQTQ